MLFHDRPFIAMAGVRMTFRHVDATFPKYFIRTYGPQAPFEIILAINPIVEMIGTPLMTGLLLPLGNCCNLKESN